MKKLLFFLTASLMLLCSCTATNENSDHDSDTISYPESSIEITLPDFGRADCIIITQGENTVVIDCGEDESGEELTKLLGQKKINSVDALFITHFDKDHIGGADKVIDAFDVKKVYFPFYSKTSVQYQEMMSSLSAKDMSPLYVVDDTVMNIGSMRLTVYPPIDMSYQNGEDNEYSLVIMLEYGERSFLFCGDAEKGRITEVHDKLEKCDFIKMPNHGDYFAVLSSFVLKVQPEYAVITASSAEPPSSKTLKLLNNAGIKTFVTSDGAVTIECDGKNISVSQ